MSYRSITIPTEDGIYPGIPNLDYHADPTSLSSTGARKLMSSPARFKWDRDHDTDPTQALDFGSAYHSTVLEDGYGVHVIDAKTRSAKAYTDTHKAIRAVGDVPILAPEANTIQRMKDALRDHTAWELLQNGAPELSGYYTDKTTGVRLRFRVDWLTARDGRPLAIDLKSTISANPSEFVKSVAKYGYHAQAAWYIDGLAALGQTDAAFLFIAQEKVAPHLVSIIELDDDAIEEGRRLNRRAIETYARCVESDVWPGYGYEVHRIGLPMWAYTADDELEIVI